MDKACYFVDGNVAGRPHETGAIAAAPDQCSIITAGSTAGAAYRAARSGSYAGYQPAETGVHKQNYTGKPAAGLSAAGSIYCDSFADKIL
jgi:hypothetical protein